MGSGGSNFAADGALTPGAAALPANLGTAFCSTDVLTGIPASGIRLLGYETGDIIPLCDGWVFVADKTNDRVVLVNVVTGNIDSIYDLPGAPEDLELDLDNKRIYASLPEAHLFASIDLISGVSQVAAVNSVPGSITQTPGAAGQILLAADGGAELRVYDKLTLNHVANSPDLKGDLIRYNPEDAQLIALSGSLISLSGVVINVGAGTVALTDVNDDPATGDPLGLEISPNFERLAAVSAEGNPSFLGPNVINDYETVDVDGTFGGWKVDSPPTAAAFSALTLADDSDYLLASSEAALVVFDVARHAEISRTTPSSTCSGAFDRVGFSRGDGIAMGKMKCVSPIDATEIYWEAPTAGFGTSASAIGVNMANLLTVLPALEVDPLCSVDAATAAASGSIILPDSEEIVALCDGVVFVGERATNRVRLINVISGVTLSEWDLPDMPGDMVIDEANKLLFVAMPGGAGVERIDLAGPNMGTQTTIPVAGFPNSLTVGIDNLVWASGHFEPGELAVTPIDAVAGVVANSPRALEVVFPSFSNQIAFDRTTDQLFVSDADGVARFTLSAPPSGGQFDLSDPAEEFFDDLASEIILDSPDDMTIAFVDQNANLVYDLDNGTIADLGPSFWDVDSLNPITAITFDGMGTRFGAATTRELIIFDAGSTHDELNVFEPASCASDATSRPAISRGGGIGFYMTNCGVASSQRIFWYEL